MDWNRAYTLATRVCDALNWEFLGGVFLLGGTWLVILLGFTLVMG